MTTTVDPRLLVRDLPRLESTTSITAIATESDTVATTTDATSLAGSVSLLDSSSFIASSSSSILETPTIVPPSPNGNPYIFSSHNRPPDGTVFIACGAFLGFIFLIILLWWAIKTYKAHRNTKYSSRAYYNSNKNYDYNKYKGHSNKGSLAGQVTSSSFSDNYDYENDDEKLIIASNNERRKSRVGIFNRDNQSEISFFDQDDISIMDPQQTKFNAIQDNMISNNNRRSLFISPTLEVGQHQEHQRASRYSEFHNTLDEADFSAISIDSDSSDYQDLDRPRLAASPERKQKKRDDFQYHRRNQSSLSFIAGPDSAPPSPTKKNHHKVPSMFLDEMLKE